MTPPTPPPTMPLGIPVAANPAPPSALAGVPVAAARPGASGIAALAAAPGIVVLPRAPITAARPGAPGIVALPRAAGIAALPGSPIAAALPGAPVTVALLALTVVLLLTAIRLIRRGRRARRRLQRLTASGGRPTGASPVNQPRDAGRSRLVAAARSRVAVPGGRRRTVIAGCAATAGLFGGVAAGPVAALAAAGYLAAAITIALGMRDARRADRSRAEALEAVTGLSADLRAGLPPTAALAAAWPSLSTSRPTTSAPSTSRAVVVVTDPVGMLRRIDEPARAAVAWRLATAWQLAESTGVPLADILDRLDTEFRDRELVRLRTGAQVAGARVTTALLAALPVAGLLLGAAIGAHPVHVLLHTPVGAACATGAMLLQLLGALWSARLTRPTDVPTTPSVPTTAHRPAPRHRPATASWAGA